MNALRRAAVPAWNATRVAAAPRAPPTTLALPKRRMGGGGGGRAPRRPPMRGGLSRAPESVPGPTTARRDAPGAPRATRAPAAGPYDDKHGPYHGHFHVSKWHEYPAIAYCTVMWLWMMYRAKQDGAWVLGIIHPWDAH